MTITRIRTAEPDDLGDTPGEPDRHVLQGAFTAPRTSSDVDGPGRDGQVIGLTLFMALDDDVVPTDQIEIDGQGVDDGTYKILGGIGRWEHPQTGWKPGQTAALERASG